MSFKDNLKTLGKKFNEASPPKKAALAGGVVGAAVFSSHFLVAGAIGALASYAGTKAYQKNKKNGPRQ